MIRPKSVSAVDAIEVRVGSRNSRSGVRLRVASVVLHELYQSHEQPTSNDIAVVTLTEDVALVFGKVTGKTV